MTLAQNGGAEVWDIAEVIATSTDSTTHRPHDGPEVGGSRAWRDACSYDAWLMAIIDGRKRRAECRQGHPAPADRSMRMRVPPEVQAEHDFAFARKHHRTLTQILCGDPMPGRSALDRQIR
jgi:hypothetical protein